MFSQVFVHGEDVGSRYRYLPTSLPPHGPKRVERILPECILVLHWSEWQEIVVNELVASWTQRNSHGVFTLAETET